MTYFKWCRWGALFCSIFWATLVFAQPATAPHNPERPPSRFTWGLVGGHAVLDIQGQNSLTIESTPDVLNPVVSTSLQQRSFQRIQRFNWSLAATVEYRLRPSWSLLLLWERKAPIQYQEQQHFLQDKVLVFEEETVSTAAQYRLTAAMRASTLWAGAALRLALVGDKTNPDLSIRLSGHAGPTFYRVTSAVSGVNMEILTNSFPTSDTLTLNNGSIIPQTKKYVPLAWQIVPEMSIRIDDLCIVNLGFRLSNLGRFKLLERNGEQGNLFLLSSIQSGRNDEVLNLVTNNNYRTIYSYAFTLGVLF